MPDHRHYMQLALAEARKSPPKPTNFCVGAVLVDSIRDEVLSTGYTLELEGNTHAEQCALQKFAQKYHRPVAEIGQFLPPGTVLYTTMEPCALRLSGNLPCVDRILQTRDGGAEGVRTVYTGVHEPEKFVGENRGRSQLEEHGVECVHISGLEDEILQVAQAGHEREA
ncbi:cytidine deaminase-like protein [Eremomyces bilateralis CBS 781.70]|uniref:Cytidine deaminase-like protein n=1 Tax=Eremomyces bilateralis CBS 781.70 TaxID=1392243 RepID=A0A6G1FX14_9PEZI|nr:cytidine deaminase-like protein [Eremomyces bilateralis CBS 781.70]KAF1810314.1 cytidine deaminase-like protein [Eremomyces bilateralis CBS 781.70]